MTGGPSGVGSRIKLDNNLRRWFNRNLGLWRSRRQYFFPDDEVLRVDMLLRVETFEDCADAEVRYRFSWWPEKEYDFFEKKTRYVREGTGSHPLWSSVASQPWLPLWIPHPQPDSPGG